MNYKFRGKSAINGSWIYGVGIKNRPTNVCLLQENNNNDNPYVMEVWHSVLPETVGQWTGLIDKNGQDIYEGDILGTHNEGKKYMPWVVEFHDGIFWAVCRNVKEKYNLNSYGIDRQHLKGLLSIPNLDKTYFIKIGNIHDNPELLEGR